MLLTGQYSLLRLFVLVTLIACTIGWYLQRQRQRQLNLALSVAAVNHNKEEILKLLDLGADPNLSYHEGGLNLMIFAAQMGDLSLVEYLLEHTNIDPMGTKGLDTNALEHARQRQFTEIERLLLAATRWTDG